MYQWLNPSHPQTLRAAVILGYLSAVFGALGSRGGKWGYLVLLLSLGLGAGAFGSANNKKVGYYALAGCATALVLIDVWLFMRGMAGASLFRASLLQQLKLYLQFLNRLVFPVALSAAALHSQSRQYQQVWFE